MVYDFEKILKIQKDLMNLTIFKNFYILVNTWNVSAMKALTLKIIRA